MSVTTVTEGGRRLMTAWRKEKVDAARHGQEKIERQRNWQSFIVHGSVGPAKRHQSA